MLKSWKTTAAAIAAAAAAWATAIAHQLDADPATLPDWGTAVAVTIAAVGLLLARDNDVTSERAGAK